MTNERLNNIIAHILEGLSALYTLLRNYFLTGVILLVPVAATIYITLLLFLFADGILGDAITRLIGWQVPGIGLISTIVIFIFVGMVAQNVIGKRLLRWIDISLQSLPVVRSLYVGIKQVSDVLFQKQQGEFQRVVMLEYPKEDCWVLGFVTGEFNTAFSSGGFPSDMVCVFVPTTPNPTSGFLLLISKSKIVDTTFGIEDAMKIIISGGMVKPGTNAPNKEPPIFQDFTIPR